MKLMPVPPALCDATVIAKDTVTIETVASSLVTLKLWVIGAVPVLEIVPGVMLVFQEM